jgi:hypothetical protein
LGDQRYVELAEKEEADRIKKLNDQQARELRAQNLKEKNDEMKARFDTNMEKEKLRQSIFGIVSTIMYLFFQFMHVTLAISAYNIGEMQILSTSITKSLFPHIDADKDLATK